MKPEGTLSHLNQRGEAHMVDVGDKSISARSATAEGYISMAKETLALINDQGHAKGDVLAVARIAGIMAAKRTSELIPLCHPLALTKVEVIFEKHDTDKGVRCQAVAETRERTGVEMEALMAVQTSLLTIYDMCKAVDRGMTIHTVRLLEKSGGRSGHWRRDDAD
tara:strand:- start:656 stop:1150 length:495 start_codon:yes stop_codon:yes gene_type:complete